MLGCGEGDGVRVTQDNYLARVQCIEVWCPMTIEFYLSYIANTDRAVQRAVCPARPLVPYPRARVSRTRRRRRSCSS